MMYSIRLDNNHVVRHQNQMRPGSILKSRLPDPDIYDDFLLNKAILEQVSRASPNLSVPVPVEDPDEQPDVQEKQSQSNQPRVVDVQVPLRRSTRQRRPPNRFYPDS